MPIRREDIIREARTLLGVPYRHQGRDPAIGIDCVGEVLVVAHRLGYATNFHFTAYERDPDPELFVGLMREHLEEIAITDLRPADVPCVRFPRRKEPQHVGILVPGTFELMMIHSLHNKTINRVVEEPYRKWQEHTMHAFRFRGVID